MSGHPTIVRNPDPATGDVERRIDVRSATATDTAAHFARHVAVTAGPNYRRSAAQRTLRMEVVGLPCDFMCTLRYIGAARAPESVICCVSVCRRPPARRNRPQFNYQCALIEHIPGSVRCGERRTGGVDRGLWCRRQVGVRGLRRSMFEHAAAVSLGIRAEQSERGTPVG